MAAALIFFTCHIADLLRGDDLVLEYEALVEDNAEKVSGLRTLKNSPSNF